MGQESGALDSHVNTINIINNMYNNTNIINLFIRWADEIRDLAGKQRKRDTSDGVASRMAC